MNRVPPPSPIFGFHPAAANNRKSLERFGCWGVTKAERGRPQRQGSHDRSADLLVVVPTYCKARSWLSAIRRYVDALTKSYTLRAVRISAVGADWFICSPPCGQARRDQIYPPRDHFVDIHHVNTLGACRQRQRRRRAQQTAGSISQPLTGPRGPYRRKEDGAATKTRPARRWFSPRAFGEQQPQSHTPGSPNDVAAQERSGWLARRASSKSSDPEGAAAWRASGIRSG